MNPELKAKWVEALRSGKYEQGEGFLRAHDETYCCLGVLYDVLAPDAQWEHGEDAWLPPVEDRVGDDDGDLPEGHFDPSVYERAGFKYADALELANMNDNGEPFSAIADYIEANL
jgi:hypothetical protein